MQPHAIANDLGEEAVATVGISHAISFPNAVAHSQNQPT